MDEDAWWNRRFEEYEGLTPDPHARPIITRRRRTTEAPLATENNPPTEPQSLMDCLSSPRAQHSDSQSLMGRLSSHSGQASGTQSLINCLSSLSSINAPLPNLNTWNEEEIIVENVASGSKRAMSPAEEDEDSPPRARMRSYPEDVILPEIQDINGVMPLYPNRPVSPFTEGQVMNWGTSINNAPMGYLLRIKQWHNYAVSKTHIAPVVTLESTNWNRLMLRLGFFMCIP
jgi:hypothetical protein